MLDFNEKQSKLLEDTLKTTLEQDEGVRWIGRPAKIKLTEAPFGTMLFLRWGLCLVLIIFAAWYAFSYAPAHDNSNGLTFFIILILVAAFIATRPIFDIKLIEEKYAYIITDNRAIVCKLTAEPKIKSAYINSLKEFDIDMLSPVAGNIYIGDKTNNSLSKSRDDTLTFPTADEKPERPLVLYNISNPYDVVKHLGDSK